MGLIRSANLVLRLVLELGALAATAYWGATAERRRGSRVFLAVAAPLAVAAVWMLFVAPGAAVQTTSWARFLVELAVFAAAGTALLRRGRIVAAAVLGVTDVVNRGLMAVWHQ